jgi:pimeloyl-ACP methyl ester carboxylesterase
MAFAQVGDLRMFYESRGSGEPLLMIFGLGGDTTFWSPRLLEQLARDFRVIAFDNRGAGRTDKPDAPYSIELFADDTAGLLHALDVPRAHVFGISMGGMIAQELVLRHPAIAQSLTLGCTTAGGEHSLPPPPEAIAALTAPRDGKTDAQIIREGWPFLYTRNYVERHREELEAGIPALIEFMMPAFAYQRQLAAILTFNTYERLEQIRTPTLVVTGADDNLLPAANSQVIAQRIPGARAHLIANSGHLFFNETTDEFLSVFVPFAKTYPIVTGT